MPAATEGAQPAQPVELLTAETIAAGIPEKPTEDLNGGRVGVA